MKYKNFEKASQLVEEIDKTEELLQELSRDEVYAVKVMFQQTTIVSIGTVMGSQNECTPIAKRFIEELNAFYKSKLNKLVIELEKL